VPAFPDNGSANLSACASGAYDGYFRTFGDSLNAAGRQNSFLQLAWEPNGDWFPWSGSDPSLFIGCWRQIVEAIRATAEPDPMVCWCINGGLSQNPPSGDPTDLYPGDAWVDVVGTSSYDHYRPSHKKREFEAKATDQGGLTWTYDFARSHGKQFAVTEWGVASGKGGGGDNPNYIAWMRNWFEARAGQGLAYEIYYNNCDRNNVGSNLYRDTGDGCIVRNNRAADKYATLW
jgi:beta-mannanase